MKSVLFMFIWTVHFFLRDTEMSLGLIIKRTLVLGYDGNTSISHNTF
jgi:hypothetical protein